MCLQTDISISHKKMVNAAFDLVGTPFLEGGRDKNGIDCYGVFLLLMKELGIESLPDPEYTDDLQFCQAALLALNDGIAYRLPEGEPPLSGDIVFFCGGRNHLGVMLSRTLFIHADIGIGCIRSTIEDKRYRRRIAGYYRMIGGPNDNR